MRQIEKMVLLQTLDHLWREHLVTLEHLRQVIGFRSYGQRDPLNEYKSEGFHLFEAMLANLREAVTGQLMHIQGVPEEDEQLMQPVELPPMQAHHVDPFTGEDELAMADAALAAGDAARRPARRAARAAADAAGAPAPSIPRTPRPGARLRATRRVPAARARSTSTATASTIEGGTSALSCHLNAIPSVTPKPMQAWPTRICTRNCAARPLRLDGMAG